jgi:hypothetical protein
MHLQPVRPTISSRRPGVIRASTVMAKRVPNSRTHDKFRKIFRFGRHDLDPGMIGTRKKCHNLTDSFMTYFSNPMEILFCGIFLSISMLQSSFCENLRKAEQSGHERNSIHSAVMGWTWRFSAMSEFQHGSQIEILNPNRSDPCHITYRTGLRPEISSWFSALRGEEPILSLRKLLVIRLSHPVIMLRRSCWYLCLTRSLGAVRYLVPKEAVVFVTLAPFRIALLSRSYLVRTCISRTQSHSAFTFRITYPVPSPWIEGCSKAQSSCSWRSP